MTPEQFLLFFDEVLETHVPVFHRDKIKSLWGKNKPLILQTDSAIDSIERESNDKIPFAAVLHPPSSYIFAFRPFIVKNAPNEILRSVVQHEMAHAFLFATLSSHGEPIYTGEINRFTNRTVLEINQSDKTNIDELDVERVNISWGGDETKVREWLSSWGDRIRKENTQTL